jgi:hypothetical protein
MHRSWCYADNTLQASLMLVATLLLLYRKRPWGET